LFPYTKRGASCGKFRYFEGFLLGSLGAIWGITHFQQVEARIPFAKTGLNKEKLRNWNLGHLFGQMAFCHLLSLTGGLGTLLGPTLGL
jgi:hypothetical protein